ncbi:MAG TPA: Asp-tRNA(Asn)/Glu-tRNA(Gln) amidotransferase subunit GatC [Candidatus Polarisedimenticolaceae bacterium]|nr:Asp-tRNA(Asn)/Glu-tRNA(Gln) amidotransferase subunit GatC [Candidatus Polarisedimenticolaceae bacterium]
MSIDRAEVLQIARLAQLELDAASVEAMQRQLGQILDYVGMLAELEGAADAVPVTVPGEPGPRADQPLPGATQTAALANAPDAAAGHFRVPRVLSST